MRCVPGAFRTLASAALPALLLVVVLQHRDRRLGGGRALGLYVRALRGAFEEIHSPKPIRNPGARIGRNVPCPCGSDRKYKHCCMR